MKKRTLIEVIRSALYGDLCEGCSVEKNGKSCAECRETAFEEAKAIIEQHFERMDIIIRYSQEG